MINTYYMNQPCESTKIYNDGFLTIEIVKFVKTEKEIAFLIMPHWCKQISSNIASFLSMKCRENMKHGYDLIDKLK